MNLKYIMTKISPTPFIFVFCFRCIPNICCYCISWECWCNRILQQSWRKRSNNVWRQVKKVIWKIYVLLIRNYLQGLQNSIIVGDISWHLQDNLNGVGQFQACLWNRAGHRQKSNAKDILVSSQNKISESKTFFFKQVSETDFSWVPDEMFC